MSQAKRGRNRSPDLHGNAPDEHPVALLLVDVINEFSFEGGERLARHALRVAQNLAELKQRALKSGVPCIYVNDNFGRWRSDFSKVVEHCGRRGSRGAPIVDLLRPRGEDYFVLKPKHSGFYQTCLSVLLSHLGTRTIILGGFTTESCVSFTAHDAYLRDYELIIPSDATASSDNSAKRVALAHLAMSLRARTPLCSEIAFKGSSTRTKLQLPT